MGAGATESSAESYAAPSPASARAGGWVVLTRHVVPGALLATGLFAVMAVTGIGTGPGPLGDCCGYGVGVRQDVGDTVTEGNVIIANRGWFPVVLEDVRPLPADGAEGGLVVSTVEVADMPMPSPEHVAIGTAIDEGYPHVPAERRHPVSGYVVQPERKTGKDRGLAEVLVRYEIRRQGVWTYRGYEVTYHSGLVRHRAVLDVTVTACAPRSAFPDGCDPLE